MLYKNPSQRCILFFNLTTVLGGSLQRCFLRTVPPKRNGTNARPRSGKHCPSSPLSHSLLSYRSVVEAPPPHSVDQSFVALHVLSFLSRNRIFYQIQIYRAFLNTVGLSHLAYHLQDFQEF